MSKTPRTDAEFNDYNERVISDTQALKELKEFARQLETELEQARAEVELLKTLVINCAEWNWLDNDSYDSIPENITSAVDLIVQEKLSLKSEATDGK